MEQSLKSAVHEFIIRNFIFEDDGSLTESMSFLENGIIDSTGVMELIAFLESTFGITVEDHEIIPENLDSIRNVSSFVDLKLSSTVNRSAAIG